MGPIAISAFQIYQQEADKRLKKKIKRKKKQQQLFVSNVNDSLSGSSSLNGIVRKTELKSDGPKPQGIIRGKAKALKRLAAGATQRQEKQLHKKRKGSSSQATSDSNADTSFESSAETSIDSPLKKAKDDRVKKATDDASKKAKYDSGSSGSWEKAKNDSGKKSGNDSSKKNKKSSDKKIIDSGKKRKEDLGRKITDDDDEVEDDFGQKAKDVSARKAKVEKKKPSPSRKRRVIESESESEREKEEETPLKQTEKRRKKSSENAVGKIPKFLLDEDIQVENSTRSGREVLQWILTPILIPAFLEKYWEQRPLYVSRSFHRDFFEGILSSKDIDKALRENSLQFTKNVDVTSYVDGVRETHNPVGRAHAFTVWDYYRNGCSVRILNPQTYFERLRKICTSLQECFNSFVGANLYLTPPNSQGFAPHYDDIEAFVLQLEGKKKWKVYQPRKGEKLPRVSSRNFTEEEMKKPLLEVELQPGDLLYMPRGFIHQACTVSGSHSLHVTISTYQHSSWADVMEKLTSAALTAAIENDPEFREGVPWDFLHNTGLVFSTDETPKRSQIQDKIQRLFSKLINYAPLDAAADQLAKEFIHESLPPMLQSSEVNVTVHGDGEGMKNGNVGHLKQLTLEHSVKLVRRNVLRMASEADEDGEEYDSLTIYHCAENPLVYKEDDIKSCRIHVDSALAIETLIRNYPKFTRIGDLPAVDDDHKMVMSLWERGILISDEPVADVSITED